MKRTDVPSSARRFGLLALALALASGCVSFPMDPCAPCDGACEDAPPPGLCERRDDAGDAGDAGPSGQTVCGHACADVQSDRAHCGSCGRACAAGEICVRGGCAGAAPVNDTREGATRIDLADHDIVLAQSSALRASGAVCNDDVGGLCGEGASLSATIPATEPDEAGLNVLLADSWDAAGGHYTIRFALAEPCDSGRRCGSACVETRSDPSHCGGCDRRCAEGETCADGRCRGVD